MAATNHSDEAKRMGDKQTRTPRLNPSWIEPDYIVIDWPSAKGKRLIVPYIAGMDYQAANELALRAERRLRRSAPSSKDQHPPR